MDYIVSIENNPYYRWQTELLIESFKMRGMQDNLLIAIAEHDGPQYRGFVKNIYEHERKFTHNNYGREKKCPYLNRAFAVLTALKHDRLRQPFTVLHPDMILYAPMEEMGEYNILFHMTPERPALRAKIKPFITRSLLGKKVPETVPWLGTEGISAFKDVPQIFFNKVLTNATQIMQSFPDLSSKEVDIAAWSVTFYEYFGLFNVKGRGIECPLVYNLDSIPSTVALHYTHGIPPFFTKLHFKFDDPVQFNLAPPDPIAVFLDYNPTTATDYLHKVVRSYRKNAK